MGPTVNYEKDFLLLWSVGLFHPHRPFLQLRFLQLRWQTLQDIGFVDGELKYVALHFRSAMKKRLPFSLGRRFLDVLGLQAGSGPQKHMARRHRDS